MVNIIVLVSLFSLCNIHSLLYAQKNITISPKAQEYRLEGYRYQEQGDLDQAIVFYRKAIDEDPSYITPYNDLGIVYEKKGLYQAAEKSYLKAIKKDNKYKAAYSNLAYLNENKGHLDRAIHYWKKRLMLEGPVINEWTKKAKKKLAQLEQRRSVRESMSDSEKKSLKKYRYERKKDAESKAWTPDTNPNNIEKEIGERYFDKGLELYNQRNYDDAKAAFRMARHHNVRQKDSDRYLVKINKIKEALAKSDITGVKAYEGVVAKEDLILAKDHFSMGLDYFSKHDYERAYSSFTMAMTYNPYDEIIKKYVEDSKIKIQEERIKQDKLKQDAVISYAASSREPVDIDRKMIKDKQDIINKGFVTTSQDVSVESFIEDGKELFARKRYGDALYVWKQAMLLDVVGLYREEIEALIEDAKIETTKRHENELDGMVRVTEEELLADVTRAAIPSAKEGAPSWTLKERTYEAIKQEGMSKDKAAIMEKLNIRYTLNFKEASLKGVVDLLAELTSLNIVIDTKEIDVDELNSNHITFKVTDMPLVQIIKAVLRFTDFDYLIEDNLIWITTKEKIRKEDIVMVVYDVQDLLGKMFDFPAEELGAGFSSSSGGSVGESANF